MAVRPATLQGLPIVITGASSGIGLATAQACAAAGMPVVLAARRLDRLEAARDDIRSKGGQAEAFTVDVSDRNSCEQLVERATESFGQLYSVFANAGYGEQIPVLPDIDAHRAQFEVNFWGSLNLIAPAVERMLPVGRGHVLLCSSCLSKIGIPRLAAYSASKAAQDHFGRAMRHELSPEGIFVSTVHPIGTRTEFFEQMDARTQGPSLTARTSERFMQTPQTVARAIVRCLRKPKGEVWTSTPTRLALAFATACPGMTDDAMGWLIRKRLAQAERDHQSQKYASK